MAYISGWLTQIVAQAVTVERRGQILDRARLVSKLVGWSGPVSEYHARHSGRGPAGNP
ncbi:hypothetical protein BRAS3843_470025 [Bradyrhizobium sp. STM 3843]|nr:hypothetical protein BRAS3843_470025 [Bradyrhizobium sp. STM 3843]